MLGSGLCGVGLPPGWALGLTSNTCSSSRSSPSELGRPPLGTEITLSTVPASAGMRGGE